MCVMYLRVRWLVHVQGVLRKYEWVGTQLKIGASFGCALRRSRSVDCLLFERMKEASGEELSTNQHGMSAIRADSGHPRWLYTRNAYKHRTRNATPSG